MAFGLEKGTQVDPGYYIALWSANVSKVTDLMPAI